MADLPRKLSHEEAQAWQPVLRELLKHENDLLNQRIGWLIQVQGLLFAALGFAWGKTPAELTLLLSALGIATAISLWSAISLYSPAVRSIKRWWQERRPDGSVEGPDIMGFWSPSWGLGRMLRPWRALPFIFIVAWVGVLAVSASAQPGAARIWDLIPGSKANVGAR